jgi:AraC-like DNA-binding protein
VAGPSALANIDAWAEKAGMSRRTFTRAFHRETGLSLSTWRQQALLFAALPRLADGEPVTRVALDLGYESVPALRRCFAGCWAPRQRLFWQGRRHAARNISAQSNRLDTLSSSAVREMASPISSAMEITRMLWASLTACVG